MQRVYRKFLSGRPPAAPKNTAIGAITLATQQRYRLRRLLDADQDMSAAQITGVAVVIRIAGGEPSALADTIVVQEGREGEALSMLQQYGEQMGVEFSIAGLIFAGQEGKTKMQFAYPIDRTPEGEAALLWSCQRQSSGVPAQAVK